MDEFTRLTEAIKQIQIVVDQSEQDGIRHSLEDAMENLEVALESLEQQKEQ